MVTPSLVMVGAPNFLSRTTLRPRGPIVTLTTLASLSTPRRNSSRAATSKAICLGIRVIPFSLRRVNWVRGSQNGEDVGLAHDQQTVTGDGVLGAGVLAEQHPVTLLHLGGD